MGCWLKVPMVGNLVSNSMLVKIFSLFITHILSENPCGAPLGSIGS